MLGMRLALNTKDLQKLSRLAHSVDPWPSAQEENPAALAIVDFQERKRDAARPKVSASGIVHGALWLGFPHSYVSHIRKDGTKVPVWPVARAKNISVAAHSRKGHSVSEHTRKGKRGKTKGHIKSEGTGLGAGSRYKASDKQMGARAGGLWADWAAQEPVLTEENRVATITSPFEYAATQDFHRPMSTEDDERFIEERMVLRLESFWQTMIEREGLA